MNWLHLGDCLEVLRKEIPDETADLIYIDPPFNSKRNYNIFFDDKDIQTQRIAFEDTWSLKNIQDSLAELQSLKTEKIQRLLTTYAEVAPFAFPYLVMMTLRIAELRRVLKPTGSFYLHCDPAMSHYLKTVCDVIFGQNNFRNEIIWKRMTASGFKGKKDLGTSHDTVIRYSKTERFIYNPIIIPYTKEYVKRYFTKMDEKGRIFKDEKIGTATGPETIERLTKEGRIYITSKGKMRIKHYLDEAKGFPADDLWLDLPPINSQADERLGYPTQKPKALLERIIKASSNEGDVVLDAFCGCGTTVDTAEGLKRQWIGIDISPIAVNLIQKRLKNTYGKALSKYEVRGVPKDEQSAIKLWEQNPFAFQDWWITEFGAFSATYSGKGADKGVDGIAKYLIDSSNNTIKAAFQVKGGKVQSKDIDALLGAMVKHKCELGVFLTIKEPTKPMLETIATSGIIETPGYKFPKLQLLTLSEFFSDRRLKLPHNNITFGTAKFKGKNTMEQTEFTE
ncbi:MAG: DNA methyltransferase [Desulfococcaceae bacterium]